MIFFLLLFSEVSQAHVQAVASARVKGDYRYLVWRRGGVGVVKILQNPKIPAGLGAVHLLESALYEDCDEQITIYYHCILPPRPL